LDNGQSKHPEPNILTYDAAVCPKHVTNEFFDYHNVVSAPDCHMIDAALEQSIVLVLQKQKSLGEYNF
jgi:hypothetical protein